MSIYRVLIVDDSRFMRKVFSDVVNADDAFTVASTAADGEEAVRLAIKLEPDIITMDMEMPRMNGLEALRRIMAVRRTPVIMLSAVTDNGTRDTIKALQYGAFDFIRKPDGAVNMNVGEVGGQLLEKLHIAAESIRGGALRMLPAVEDEGESLPPQLQPQPPAAQAAAAHETRISPTLDTSQVIPSEISRKKENIQKRHVPPPAPEMPEAARWQPPPERTDVAAVPPKDKPNISKPVPRAATADIAGRHSPPVDSRSPVERKTPGLKPVKSSQAQMPQHETKRRSLTAFQQIVAVGTSTGGPRALHELLTNLPEDFAAPVLVVQHMPPKFTHSLAQRLDSFSAIRVCEATHGEVIETATAYIAPGGKHMSLVKEASGKYRIRLSEEGPRSGHMPSVDVLFESLVGHRGLKRHIVLMTGMGSDGAKGMKALQDDGAETRIAEAEETCVIYGMPRSAVELGAANHVLPLQQIASFLAKEINTRKA